MKTYKAYLLKPHLGKLGKALEYFFGGSNYKDPDYQVYIQDKLILGDISNLEGKLKFRDNGLYLKKHSGELKEYHTRFEGGKLEEVSLQIITESQLGIINILAEKCHELQGEPKAEDKRLKTINSLEYQCNKIFNPSKSSGNFKALDFFR